MRSDTKVIATVGASAMALLLVFSVWWITKVVGALNVEVRRTSADYEIDATISSLDSATIVQARQVGSETILTLADGRTIVVRGYKGHHFYERRTR